jgi:3-isopropylmalate/(R)-2-methylmalate dehydratase large subunit
MASIWALGSLWLKVPESLKILVHGALPEGVFSKDLALQVIGDLGSDGALYMSVEWHGKAVERLELADRAVLPNMSAEMGAKNSFLMPDQKVLDYLQGRAKRSFTPILPDPGASYARVLEYNAADLEPMIACPHTVDHVKPLREVAGTPVNQAFLGTCTNGRLEDLAVAAAILDDRTLDENTRLIVIPASSEIYLQALRKGYIETFLRAGAVIESPGCGPCMGNHMGVPAVGEVVISTANRNFMGRMGTKESEIYLASPAVVAASAVAGKISHPHHLG